MTDTGKVTKRIRGSRIVDRVDLAAKGWPVEHGRHRHRRGRTHVTAYLQRLPLFDHPRAPIALAVVTTLTIPAVLALVIAGIALALSIL